MKRIAVLFSGRIISYEKCFSHFQSIIDKYNPTFFLSLNLSEIDEYTKTFCEKFNIRNEQLNVEKTIVPESLNKISSCSNVKNTYSMFYHNYKAFCLIKKYQNNYNINFDVIVKYRADINSSEMLNLEDLDKDILYIPKGCDYGGLNDQIAYGDLNVMEKYCELGNGFIETLHFTKNVRYHPETLLLNYHKFYFSDIKINRPHFSYSLNSERKHE